MERTPESFIKELDYWKAATDDVLLLNEKIATAAEKLVAIPTLALTAIVADKPLDAANAASEVAVDVLGILREMQAPMEGLVQLLEGRMLALKAEWETDE